jgi:hypothetical protein
VTQGVVSDDQFGLEPQGLGQVIAASRKVPLLEPGEAPPEVGGGVTRPEPNRLGEVGGGSDVITKCITHAATLE